MKRILLPALLGTLCTSAHASGWIEPNNIALRHDIQLLSDYSLLKIPTSSWPLRWTNIQHSLAPLPDNAEPMIQNAYGRVQSALNSYRQRKGRLSTTLSTTVGEGQNLLQGFGPAQRSESSMDVAMAADAGALEGRLSYSTAMPSPPQFHAFDHSYIGGNLGNWNVGVDMLDRWWGPGWDGSLILSNNPHPIPTLSFQRNHTTPFDTWLLNWLGPWDTNVRFGQFEEERTIPRGQFFAMRVVFQPLSGLELGFSRGAQWGGEGRSNGIDAFFNMLLGKDNGPTNGHPENEPGNQIGGYDLRWSFTPLQSALYGQIIGEDESGMLPTAKMMLFGIENWGVVHDHTYRLFFEYADTATYRGFDFDRPGYNTAYNNHLFRSGYRYYGESLGHSADNDSYIRSFGLLTTNNHGWSTHTVYRNGVINRDNAGLNPLSNNRIMTLHEWSMRIDKRINELEASLQIGNSRREAAGGSTDERVVSVGFKIHL